MELELGFGIIRSLLLTSILFLALKSYLQTKLKTLLYLIISVSSYLFVELLIMANLEVLDDSASNELAFIPIESLFVIFLSFFATIITFYLLRLFLESFNSEQVLTRGTIILGSITLVISTGFILSSGLAATTIIDYRAENLVEDANYLSILSIWTIWAIFILLAALHIIILIISIYRGISKKQDMMDNDDAATILRYMKYSVMMILIGTIGPVFISIEQFLFWNETVSTLSTFGLCLFVAIYLKNGVHTLSDRSLRRLLIINEHGVPIYGYVFQSYLDSKMKSTEPFEQEILFSGAIKAISSLMNEFTGTDDHLVELELESNSILIEELADNLSILLLTTNPTLSDRSLLRAAVLNIRNSFETIPTTQITNAQIKVLNNITEKIFGPGEGSN